MAEKRGIRAESEMPAEGPRGPDDARGESRNGDSRNEVKRGSSDSHLRIVTPDVLFPEGEFEPNDESPTIISKLPGHGDPNAARDSNDLRGRKLAHFELIEPIGVGGMAAVLRARDSQLDRFVALKILPPETARDLENIRRFHQEARAAAKLDHENIARVFYCGEDQGLHFIAFEFVEGDNLRKILERRGPMPWREAVRYVMQVAVGLEHAATREVVHRDIKPSNIIIGPDGRAKVVDMGLARSLEPQGDLGLTQSGVTLGTFDYISPEQALEPRDADCRSDIYSLGCTLYHMLTGQPPVPEGTAAKKLQHHQHIAPVDPRQINPDIPDELAQILGKMMAKNARDRYQRPMQVVQDLSRFLKSRGDNSGQEPAFLDVQSHPPAPRRPILMVSMALLLLAGLLFVLSLAPPGSNTGNPPTKSLPPRPVSLAKSPAEERIKVAPVASVPTQIRTEDELQAAIDRASDTDKTVISLAHDIALTGKLKIAGTSRSHPQIDIVGSERSPVRLSLHVDKEPTAALTGVLIENARVNFKNIRFEIVADSVKRFDVPVAAVAVGSGGGVDCERCSFAQLGVPLDIPFIERRASGLIPAASVLVGTEAKTVGDNSRVTLRECYFPNGQAAVAISGAASVTASDCAFHSLGTLFHIKGGGEPIVSLDHCSAYLRNGPAYLIDGETGCRLVVEYSLFDNPATSAANPGYLRQVDSAATNKIVYQGQSNGYRNLNLWVAGSKVVMFDEPANFKLNAAAGSYDKDSQFLKDAAPFLQESAGSDDLMAAFQLNPSLREVQVPREKHAKHPMLGIRACLGTTMPRLPPLAVDPAPAVSEYRPAANEKVVDADHVGNQPGYYDSIGTAVADAQPGDIITLKPSLTHPDFSLKPTDLENDLTIRGFPGTFPTLALGKTNLSDASLFRLLDGKLQLENLNLVVEPSRDGFASQSLVSIVGGGSCAIRGCTITLKPRDRSKSIPLSVVSLLAGEDVKMMMTNEARPSMPPPSITLQDCLIRGEGDVVSLRGSRPVNVSVSRSLCFLGGSLLHQLQAATKEIPSPDFSISLKLRESVIFFAEPMIWVQAGRAMPRYQHPLHVESVEKCLFVTLGDRALIALETPEMTEKTVMQHVEWKGHGNAFVHFDKAYVLEYTPADEAVLSFHLDDLAWREAFEQDGPSAFLLLAFKSLPPRPLVGATPEDAALRPDAVPELRPYLSQLPQFHLPKN
jgi:serine/threonine protein kinase